MDNLGSFARSCALFVVLALAVSVLPNTGDYAATNAHRTHTTEAVSPPPSCDAASPTVEMIWPPNHRFVDVAIVGVTDPEGDPVTTTVDGIRQDEPIESRGDGSFSPDGKGVGTSTAQVRAERSGSGNGRFYHIAFTADDGRDGTCSGVVRVHVPHDRRRKSVDEGPLYDSTRPPVDERNTPPEASAEPSALTLHRDADPTTVNLRGTDAQTPPSELRVTFAELPEHGTLRHDGELIDADTLLLGTPVDVTYQPHAGFVGDDAFSFTVTDSGAGTHEPLSDTAAVTISVAEPPRDPVAVDDVVVVAEDGSVRVDVRENDSHPDGLGFWVSEVGEATHGEAALVTVGEFEGWVLYAPQADFSGEDTFTYTITDGHAATAQATVSVTVTEANDPPVAGEDQVSTTRDAPVSVPVADLLANDVAGPANESAQSLTVTGVQATGDTNGVVELADGVVTYTPEAGFVGEASFLYEVCDDGTTAGAPDPQCAPGTAAVDVVAPHDTVGLVLDIETLRIRDVGSTATLGAFLVDGDSRTAVGTDPGTTYSSSDAGVVEVGPAGVLTFRGVGSADVTVRYEEFTASAHVEVDPAAAPAVTSRVGVSGGRVALPGGPSVLIPSGALSAEQTVAIEETTVPDGSLGADDGQPVGPAYEFTPHNLIFDAPVTLTVPYNPADLPNGGADEGSLLVMWEVAPGDWRIDGPSDADEEDHESVSQGVDFATNTVQVTTDHFSRRQLTIGRFPQNPVTLTAPDGTQLRVFQHLKQQVTCGAGAAPVNVPNRPAGSTVDYIVLHNTGNPARPPRARFLGEVRRAADAGICTGAHYYVDKDGTIVQVYTDNQVARHIGFNGPDPDNAAATINRNNSIGIEIFNNSCGPGSTVAVCAPPENYPGAQISAVTRLVDFLLRAHPTTTRPGPGSRGNIRMHAEIPTPGSPRTDPEGQFRTAVMGTPSLEQVVYQALRPDHDGLVKATGGDGLGASEGGDGGDVVIEYGNSTLENAPDQNRRSLIVPAGTQQAFAGPTDLMHLLVEGELLLTGDTALDVDGTFYLGPNGRITASGNAWTKDGHSLTITADGIALIEGSIDTSGHDSTLADGDGGDAGDFTFRTAAPGPAIIPTVITRGGDADTVVDNTVLKQGGDGGAVIIRGRSNNAADPVSMHFEGSDEFPADTLPPPPPFNQMPVVVGSATEPPSEWQCQRPVSGERLPLGRDAGGANISNFRRGILTVGGIGGASDVTRQGTGGPGGNGGRIEILNDTTGLVWADDIGLFTGAGVEGLCYKITIASLGGPRIFGAPSGALGGKGSLNSGSGGQGGNAGDIAIQSAVPLPPATSTTPVLGYNGESPSWSSAGIIGQLRRYQAADGSPTFTVSVIGGSGGSPGGAWSGFPGWFGPRGRDGTLLVNGQPQP